MGGIPCPVAPLLFPPLPAPAGGREGGIGHMMDLEKLVRMCNSYFAGRKASNGGNKSSTQQQQLEVALLDAGSSRRSRSWERA